MTNDSKFGLAIDVLFLEVCMYFNASYRFLLF